MYIYTSPPSPQLAEHRYRASQKQFWTRMRGVGARCCEATDILRHSAIYPNLAIDFLSESFNAKGALLE